MKIVVLEGSPNKNGSSNMLANELIRGAQEAGHTVQVIDAAHSDIRPCTGCIHCGYEGPCVQKDDMEKFRGMILDADMVVFVTPLYYYGMSAQLKTLIDRFCAFNSSIQNKHMKSAMLAAAWNSDTAWPGPPLWRMKTWAIPSRMYPGTAGTPTGSTGPG